MLTLYHSPQTRSSAIVWLLEELGAPYEIAFIDVRTDAGAPESYRDIHAHKKVPAVVHDGAVITERAAICAYLCDAFPQAGLAPPIGDPRRGPYLSWLVYNDAVMDPVLAAKIGKWQYDKRGVSFGVFDDMVAHLERTLSRTPYLTGESFTAADLLLSGGLNLAVTGFKLVPATPAITGFLERCLVRPAYKLAMAKGAAPA